MKVGAWSWILYGGVVLALILFVVTPVLLVLGGAVQDPLYLYEALAHPVYREGLVNAVTIACIVTVLSGIIALPLAWLAWRFRFRGRGIAEALLLAPLILPPFVGALGVFQVFGTYGVINTIGERIGLWSSGLGPDWLGDHRFALVTIVEALHLYPVLFLTLRAAFARLDPCLLEAASSLGATPFATARRIMLPLLKPGLFAGGVVVFVWSLTELGTPLMLGYDRVTPVQVWNGLADIQNDSRLPFALVLILMMLATLAFAVGRLLTGRQHEALVAKGGGTDASSRLTGWRSLLVWLPFACIALLATLPHLSVALLSVAGDWHRTILPEHLSLDRYHEALANPMVVPSIINSLGYSLAATVVGLILGGTIAWITARWKPRGSGTLDALAMVPLAVPGLIMAFGFLTLGTIAGRWLPSLREWIDPRSFPVTVLVLAYAIRRLPHVVRAIHAGYAQAPVVLEEAAAACGAGPFTRLRRITLPLIAGSVAAGAIMTFSFSMLEVSDSMVIAQQRDYWPVTRVIYDLTALLGTGPAVACAFATWAMLFLAAALAAAAAFLGRGPASLLKD